MKKSMSFFLGFLSLSLLTSIVILTISFAFILDNENRVFNMCFKSVVELKAYSNDVGESYGSAVIYDSKGYLITNSHVISYTKQNENYLFDNISIRFSNKEIYEKCDVIKYDYDFDLAIIKIETNNERYSKIKFASKECDYGDTIYSVGNTSNYGIGISKGIVSVPLVNIIYGEKEKEVIQVDISISSGNSGGALLNRYGKLLGITTFRTKDDIGNINYGFAYSIPISIVKEFIGGK